MAPKPAQSKSCLAELPDLVARDDQATIQARLQQWLNEIPLDIKALRVGLSKCKEGTFASLISSLHHLSGPSEVIIKFLAQEGCSEDDLQAQDRAAEFWPRVPAHTLYTWIMGFKISSRVTTQQLLGRLEELNSDSHSIARIIGDFQLHDSVDVRRYLTDALKLKAEAADVMRVMASGHDQSQRIAIELLGMRDNKNAVKLAKLWHYSAQDFPQVFEEAGKRTVRWMIRDDAISLEHLSTGDFVGHNPALFSFMIVFLARSKRSDHKYYAIRAREVFNQWYPLDPAVESAVQPLLGQINSLQPDMRLVDESTHTDVVATVAQWLPGGVHWVDTLPKFEEAVEKLHQEHVIGIDTEWRPPLGVGEQRTGIMQLATAEECFIFDMVVLAEPCGDRIVQLLREDRTMVGFSWPSDRSPLKNRCPSYNGADNVIDVARATKLLPGSPRSLAAAVEAVLGRKLCKDNRLADWERRPLRPEHLAYAALDAAAARLVYLRVLEIGGPAAAAL